MAWSYNVSSSTLTISGSGDMYNFSSCGPWSPFAESMVKIVIKNGVKSIGSHAFSLCHSVKTVTMGDSVKSLGSYSFYFMTSLSSVKLSNSLESIGSYAFSTCSSLLSIGFPNSLLRIEPFAFHFSALSSVTIPASVTFIDESAFRGCGNLASFAVNKSNKNFVSTNDVLFSKNGTILYFYPILNSRTNYTIPAKVVKVCDHAFFRTKKLNSIYVESGNKFYSSRDGVLFDKDFTVLIRYPSKKTSTTYSVPKTVKTIVNSAFHSASNLVTVNLQEGVTTLGEGCFGSCSKLKAFTIPSSLTQFGTGVFFGCSAMSSIQVNKNNTIFKSRDGILFTKDDKTIVQYPKGKTGTHYSVPEGVTEIGNGAFRDSDLKTISLPSSLNVIGSDAFYRCQNLTSIVIPASVTTINHVAFGICTSLKSITFLGSVKSLYFTAFDRDSNVKSFTYLGTSAPNVTIPGLAGVGQFCVIPEYEGNNFFGHENMKKSLRCEIDATNAATIRSTEGFHELIDIASDTKKAFNFNVNLDYDIDLEQSSEKLRSPLGMDDNTKSCNVFKGVFDGKGHSVKNLKMVNISNDSSFFCGLDGATIKNVKIDKSCKIEGRECSVLSITAKGQVVLENITNEAKIKGKLRGAGLISSVSNETKTVLTIKNCMNSGDIVVPDGIACGLICRNDGNVNQVNITVVNSVNYGDLEGKYIYGISNYASEANNLVSLGNVRNIVGENETYSFWPVRGTGRYSNLYGRNGTCVKCDDYNVTFFSKDSKKKAYVIDDENHTRVDDLLNAESNEKNYGMLWSNELELEEQLIVHIIIESGTAKEHKVNYATKMNDIEEIKPYFEQNQTVEYIMFESERKSIVVLPEIQIYHDINVTIKKIPDPDDQYTIISVDLYKPMDPKNVDIMEVIQIFCYYSNIDADSITVTIEVDETGNVTEITVYTKDKDGAYRIEKFVNDDTPDCSQALCRNLKSARVIDKNTWMSIAPRIEMMTVAVLFCFVFLLLLL